MRTKQLIEELSSLAERFGLSITFDEFDGRGGWCRVKDSERVIINKRLTPQEQVRILASILSQYPLDEISMPPKVRQLLEDAKQGGKPQPGEEPPEETPDEEPDAKPPIETSTG